MTNSADFSARISAGLAAALMTVTLLVASFSNPSTSMIAGLVA